MEVKNQPNLSLKAIDIVDVKFSIVGEYDRKIPVNLNIIPKVFYPKDAPNHFKISMEVHLNVPNSFELSAIALGDFEVNNDLATNVKESLINTNAPAIVFPYIRSFITTLTANCGNVVGTITIPAQFFKGKLEEIKDLE